VCSRHLKNLFSTDLTIWVCVYIYIHTCACAHVHNTIYMYINMLKLLMCTHTYRWLSITVFCSIHVYSWMRFEMKTSRFSLRLFKEYVIKIPDIRIVLMNESCLVLLIKSYVTYISFLVEQNNFRWNNKCTCVLYVDIKYK